MQSQLPVCPHLGTEQQGVPRDICMLEMQTKGPTLCMRNTMCLRIMTSSPCNLHSQAYLQHYMTYTELVCHKTLYFTCSFSKTGIRIFVKLHSLNGMSP